MFIRAMFLNDKGEKKKTLLNLDYVVRFSADESEDNPPKPEVYTALALIDPKSKELEYYVLAGDVDAIEEKLVVMGLLSPKELKKT